MTRLLSHQDIVRLWRLRAACQNRSRKLADDTEGAPDVKTSFLAASFFVVASSHPVSAYLTIGTSSASLSGRKPLAFGSHMKYESESHWMRIVRSCRWNQSQQQWGVTSARLSFNLRELQAPYSPP